MSPLAMMEPDQRRARMDEMASEDPLEILTNLGAYKCDMVLRAVRIGIEGDRVINRRHIVSHEYATPYEVSCILITDYYYSSW
jgi:hypothetical protein